MRKTWMFYGLFFYFSLFGGLANAQDALTQLQQMYMMKELLPEMQTAGIIVNGSSVDMAELQQKLERVSATLKIKIVISDARSLKDVSAEFKKITGNHSIDMLWVYQADDVLGNNIAKDFLIKNSVIQKIPMLVPDETWVKAGAFIALCKKEGKTSLSVNPQTAKALGIYIPEKHLPQTEFFAAQ